MRDERMPEAELYELELEYMPYRDSVEKVVEIIAKQAPKNTRLRDIMCGTGYLLNRISQVRPDLELMGADIDERYVEFARGKYPHIQFSINDARRLVHDGLVHVVTCTGALHHVPWNEQEKVVQNMANMLIGARDSFCLVSDCYIDNYNTEGERKTAAAKLGYEYLKASVKKGCPDSITQILIDIMRNDVMGVEFKTALWKRLPIFGNLFEKMETYKTWPPEAREGYGDYITVLSGPKI